MTNFELCHKRKEVKSLPKEREATTPGCRVQRNLWVFLDKDHSSRKLSNRNPSQLWPVIIDGGLNQTESPVWEGGLVRWLQVQREADLSAGVKCQVAVSLICLLSCQASMLMQKLARLFCLHHQLSGATSAPIRGNPAVNWEDDGLFQNKKSSDFRSWQILTLKYEKKIWFCFLCWIGFVKLNKLMDEIWFVPSIRSDMQTKILYICFQMYFFLLSIFFAFNFFIFYFKNFFVRFVRFLFFFCFL